jgi:hypothetical protein
MLYPTITKTPHWTADSVRAGCIRNDLYTRSDSEAYTHMLDQVAKIMTPSDIGIWMIAKDITEHSDMQTVTNVMYILANEAVTYTYELDGNDNI